MKQLRVAMYTLCRPGWRKTRRFVDADDEHGWRPFQGTQHGHKYFTIWYGVYPTATRALTYASGGHPAAIVLTPDELQPLLFPATGPVMGMAPGMQFPAMTFPISPGSRLFVLSDGVFEIRRDKRIVWNQTDCIANLDALTQREENVMDVSTLHVRELHGSQ